MRPLPAPPPLPRPERPGLGAPQAARVQEAKARGIQFLTIDASPMSRAIVEKLGFQFMAYAWECNYGG